MDSTIFASLLSFVAILTFTGIYTKVRLLNLITMPILLELAIEEAKTNYFIAFGMIAFMLFQAYYAFFWNGD